MYYYAHHINDFRGETSHLSNAAELAYRRLLDLYYDKEQPIPLDVKAVAKRIRSHFSVVISVLKEFFIQREEGFRHARCEADIEKYQSKADAARAAANARWEKNSEKISEKFSNSFSSTEKNFSSAPTVETPENPVPAWVLADDEKYSSDADALRLQCGGIANPITQNLEPKNLKPKTLKATSKTNTARAGAREARERAVSIPSSFTSPDVETLTSQGVTEQHAKDWLLLRKAKRIPLTATALDGIRAEALYAGLTLDAAIQIAIERGWGTFKADWIKPKQETRLPTRHEAIMDVAAQMRGIRYGKDQAATSAMDGSPVYENGFDLWPALAGNVEGARSSRSAGRMG